MYRIVQYIALFLCVAALQILLFDNLQLSLYVHPFVYLAFLLLLPMETPGHLLLLLAAAMGITMDFFSGYPGVNTLAVTAAAFCRPTLLRFLVGKEVVTDGGVPNARRLGTGKFLRYALILTAIHAIVFFTLETLSTTGILFTLLRIVASLISSLAVIWFVQLLFITRKTPAR